MPALTAQVHELPGRQDALALTAGWRCHPSLHPITIAHSLNREEAMKDASLSKQYGATWLNVMNVSCTI
eukprot:1153603-Pelagomonas_calceolata.AAC.1